jgi:hypothetical protein
MRKRLTNEEWAARALRNGITRANKYLAQGQVEKAAATLLKAEGTAYRWLHPDEFPQTA